MPTTTKAFRWRVIARSEQGASHIRNNLPNQDALQPFVLPDGKPPVVLAVADGHGSPKSFRSDIGARYAAESAVSLCSEFLRSIGDASPSAIKNSAEQQLPRQIIETWKQRVAQHFKENPFSQAELNLLAQERYLMAYGSTLLMAAISDTFLLYFQLGDGEMLVVSDATGEVSRPIPRDEALIANETTSLCMDNPLPEFRFRFQYFPESPPGIVLLSTDGYPNSFRSQDDFLKVGTDLLKILRTEGGDAVERDLSGWLREASSGGSGDDVTLGIMYRLEPPLWQPTVPPPATLPPSATVEQPADPISTAGPSERTAHSPEIPPNAPSNVTKTPDSGANASERASTVSHPEGVVGSSPTGTLQAQPEQDSVVPLLSRPSSTLHKSGGDDETIAPTESADSSDRESPDQVTTEERSDTTKHPSKRGLGSLLMSPFSLFKRKD
jgi:serine/threonine protein phosphatase PrpC